MSLMNALTVTLLALILGCALALFFGLRAAQADDLAKPDLLLVAPAAVELTRD